MNDKAREYWDEFWQGFGQKQIISAEQFGYADIADELAQLIVDGKKTATCSIYSLYEIENEPLPAVGQYTIVLSSKDDPVAIVRTSEVLIVKMNEVPEELALAEGEGDLTYQYWWNSHKEAFTAELGEHGMDFREDMLLVFEKFELVDVNRNEP